MKNNYYDQPFTFRHGLHQLVAVRLDLAEWITDDGDPPVPDPAPEPPVPEPEPPTPVPIPEPCPPVPDDPVPPPPEVDSWPIDRHVFPGFLILVPEPEVKAVVSHKGRGYQTVNGATLTAWALDPDCWEAHLDKTLAEYADWRAHTHYVFTVPAEHDDYAKLLAYVLRRGGVVIAP